MTRIQVAQRRERRAVLATGVAALASPLVVGRVRAQEGFPARPIRLVVPYATGSGSDNTARHIAQRVSEKMGWRILVENKPGGNAFLGLQEVLRAPADGYIVTIAGGSTHGANSAMFKKLPYDPIADFIPIAPSAFAPLVLLAAPALNVSTAGELLALLRRDPGKWTYASGSAFQRLAGEIFREMANVDVAHTAYKGSAQSMNDLIGGHVAYTFVDSGAAMPYLQAGKLKALAVTSARRVAALPDTPTMAEAGMPDMRLTAWSAIFAPRGTPAAAVNQLRRGFGEFVGSEEWNKFLAQTGGFWQPMTGEELSRFIEAEIARYQATFKRAGIEPE